MTVSLTVSHLFLFSASKPYKNYSIFIIYENAHKNLNHTKKARAYLRSRSHSRSITCFFLVLQNLIKTTVFLLFMMMGTKIWTIPKKNRTCLRSGPHSRSVTCFFSVLQNLINYSIFVFEDAHKNLYHTKKAGMCLRSRCHSRSVTCFSSIRISRRQVFEILKGPIFTPIDAS